MTWSSVKSWFGSKGEARTARFTLPASVIEIEPGFVAGVRFEGGKTRTLRRVSVREFAPAAIQVSFQRPNVAASGEVAEAVEAVRAVIGNGGASAGLLVPDGSVRTVILGFESLPDDRREADALIRWRLLERLAIPNEEIVISYQDLGPGTEGVELLVTAAKRAVLAGYVAALGPGATPPALILPSTAALLPLVPSDGDGGDLIVHLAGGWVSLVVVGHERVTLWRTRPVRADREAELGAEVRRAATSARDRHHLEVRRMWISVRPRSPIGAGPASTASSLDSPLAEELGKAISAEVRILEPLEAQMNSLSETEKAVFKQFGAPVSGLLANRD